MTELSNGLLKNNLSNGVCLRRYHEQIANEKAEPTMARLEFIGAQSWLVCVLRKSLCDSTSFGCWGMH
jgi:hypothetical protein